MTSLGFIDRWVSRIILLGSMVLGQMGLAPIIPGEASGWFESTIALAFVPIGYGIAFVAARRLDQHSSRRIGPLLRMLVAAFGLLFFFFVLIGVLGILTTMLGGTPSPPDSVTTLPSQTIGDAFTFLFVTFLGVGVTGLASCIAVARGVRWGVLGFVAVMVSISAFATWAAIEMSDSESAGFAAFFGSIAVAASVFAWRHWGDMSWRWFVRSGVAPSVEQAPPADSGA